MYGLPRNLIFALVDATAKDINIPPVFIEKDIHVTQSIKLAVVQSERYPDTRIVFHGGTALAKSGIIKRFSEDIDINMIPPPDRKFGDGQQKSLRREIVGNFKNKTPLTIIPGKPPTAGYTEIILEYPQLYKSNIPMPSARLVQVKAEFVIRAKYPGYHHEQEINSYIGDYAKQAEPALLEEYPALRPFKVLTASPLVSLVDKLDAMNRAAEQERFNVLQKRVRDTLDIACILSHQPTREKINTEEICKLHEHLVQNLRKPKPGEEFNRPEGGFAASKAFQEGSEANRALETAYGELRQWMHHDEDWIPFGAAMEIIRSSEDIL